MAKYFINFIFSYKSINYTLLGAITNKEILGFKIIKGSCKSKIFLAFLFELLIRI